MATYRKVLLIAATADHPALYRVERNGIPEGKALTEDEAIEEMDRQADHDRDRANADWDRPVTFRLGRYE